MRLSYSAMSMYQMCPQKYKMHYLEKYRSPFLDSPLFTGGAIDSAFGRILLEKKKVLNDEEKKMATKTEFQIFDEEFTKTMHLGEEIDLSTSIMCNYSKGDYEHQLLEDDDIKAIIEFADSKGMTIESTESIDEYMLGCFERKKLKQWLDSSEQSVYNYISWSTLRRKAHFMLEKYREEVLPLIEEVFAIQKKITLTAGDDTFIGYIDFNASFHEEPGVMYTIDNKFAATARGYEVEDSAQLTVYCEHEEHNRGAYIIAEKKLRKREPKHRIAIKKGIIPESTFEEVFDVASEVLEAIKNEEFEQNTESCFSFGKKCPYYANCKGLSDPLKGLVRR